jgi:hypothetical protein
MRVGEDRYFPDYALLGDDIVIADRDVAEEYRDIMSWLGVEINLSKSVVGCHAAEFAKRHFYRGHEVSGIPARLATLVSRVPSGLRVLVETLVNRGWSVEPLDLISSLAVFGLVPRRLGSYLLVSLFGPGAPLERSALWGTFGTELGVLLETLVTSPASSGDHRCNLGNEFAKPLGLLGYPSLPEETSHKAMPEDSGPRVQEARDLVPYEEVMVRRIVRLFDLERIKLARESVRDWTLSLATTLDSLIKGFICESSEIEGKPVIGDSDHERRFARELLDAGHPVREVSQLSEMETTTPERDLYDLDVQLVKGDRLSSSVISTAPSGVLVELQKAADGTRYGFRVLNSVITTLGLIVEVRGAQGGHFPESSPDDSVVTVDMIADGLIFSINPEIVRDPAWVPPPPRPRKRVGGSRKSSRYGPNKVGRPETKSLGGDRYRGLRVRTGDTP